MNKQILFIFSLIITTNVLGHEKLQSQKIKFSDEEYEILSSIFGWLSDSRIKTTNNYVLGINCGWGSFNYPKDYDPKEHPFCAQILEFLKRYKKQALEFDAESNNLIKEVWKR